MTPREIWDKFPGLRATCPSCSSDLVISSGTLVDLDGWEHACPTKLSPLEFHFSLLNAKLLVLLRGIGILLQTQHFRAGLAGQLFTEASREELQALFVQIHRNIDDYVDQANDIASLSGEED